MDSCRPGGEGFRCVVRYDHELYGTSSCLQPGVWMLGADAAAARKLVGLSKAGSVQQAEVVQSDRHSDRAPVSH